MKTRLLAAAPLALCLGLTSLPAHADLVIQGRAAQALHCAAMLFMVSDTLYDAGLLDYSTANSAQENAVRMLEYVPGTEEQKVQAMGQRFAKLTNSRSLEMLLDEYNKTSSWCEAAFL